MAVKGLLTSIAAVIVVAAGVSYPYKPSGYLGCFMNRHHTILSKKLTYLNQNSGDNCKMHCHGYRYSGTEVSYKCFCGNCLHSPIYAAKTDCNYTCPGSKTLEYCGGNWRLSLYDNLPSAIDMLVNCSTTARPSAISVSSKTHQPTLVADSQSGILTTTLSASTATDTWSNTVSTATLHASTATDTWPNTVPTTTLYASTSTNIWSNTISTATLHASTATDTWPNTISTATLFASTATDIWSNQVPTTTLHASTATDIWSNTVPTTTLIASTATDTWSNSISTARFSARTATDTWPDTISTARISVSTATDTVSSGTTFTEAKQYKTEPTNVSSEWITVNNTQFHVVGTKMNFSNALEHCRNMNAQLISYANPLRYFVLPKSIGLKNNSYWIGAYGDNLVNTCPTLVKNGTYNRIRLEQCSYTKSFICSRTANLSKVADDHDFAELLKDMTIDVKKTNKAKRKLISAEDRRRSATFVGGTGIIIFCIFIALVIFADINWKRCQCVSKRKNV